MSSSTGNARRCPTRAAKSGLVCSGSAPVSCSASCGCCTGVPNPARLRISLLKRALASSVTSPVLQPRPVEGPFTAPRLAQRSPTLPWPPRPALTDHAGRAAHRRACRTSPASPRRSNPHHAQPGRACHAVTRPAWPGHPSPRARPSTPLHSTPPRAKPCLALPPHEPRTITSGERVRQARRGAPAPLAGEGEGCLAALRDHSVRGKGNLPS